MNNTSPGDSEQQFKAFLGRCGLTVKDPKIVVDLDDETRQALFDAHGFAVEDDIFIHKLGALFNVSKARIEAVQEKALKRLRSRKK